jgi:predicted nucleotidyltransferase
MKPRTFSTILVDRKKREHRVRREQMRSRLIQELFDLLQISPIPIDEAFIFGSIVFLDRFDSSSDVDVAVHALAPREYFDLKLYLEHGLERPVDLVELESCRFTDSIVRKGVRWKRTVM